jgi:flagellar basal-body rod protein FlgB
MLGQHNVFRAAGQLASHAADRQQILAQNVANSDTPGYTARDLPKFAVKSWAGSSAALTVTRRHHFQNFAMADPTERGEVEPGPLSPNGNGVSLEREMVRAAEISRQHDLALTVYSNALGILRTSMGRGR